MRLVARFSPPPPQPAAGWPELHASHDAVRADGRLLAGFELAPLNLELLADAERAAALESLAALYDAIPRPFQLLSVPARRDPNDHLGRLADGLGGRRAKQAFASYAALFRKLAADPRRPLRATYLVLNGGTPADLERATELVRRVSEERDVGLRAMSGRELADLWAAVGGAEREHRLGAHVAAGDGLVAALQVLAAMVEAGRPASELLDQFEPVPQLLKNVRFNGGAPLDDAKVKARITAAEAELDGRGRLVIRKSGTEPLVRVMVEAATVEQAQALADSLAAAVRAAGAPLGLLGIELETRRRNLARRQQPAPL